MDRNNPLHIIQRVKLETLIKELVLHGGNIREDETAEAEKRKHDNFLKGISRYSADALSFTLTSLLVSAGNKAIN